MLVVITDEPLNWTTFMGLPDQTTGAVDVSLSVSGSEPKKAPENEPVRGRKKCRGVAKWLDGERRAAER